MSKPIELNCIFSRFLSNRSQSHRFTYSNSKRHSNSIETNAYSHGPFALACWCLYAADILKRNRSGFMSCCFSTLSSSSLAIPNRFTTSIFNLILSTAAVALVYSVAENSPPSPPWPAPQCKTILLRQVSMKNSSFVEIKL